jgi:hypothetical protein
MSAPSSPRRTPQTSPSRSVFWAVAACVVALAVTLLPSLGVTASSGGGAAGDGAAVAVPARVDADGAAQSGQAAKKAKKGKKIGFFPTKRPQGVRKDKDTSSIELGMRFRTVEAGKVLGVQVYKAARGRGKTPKKATLWGPGGQRLASAKIGKVKGKGWVKVTFAKPVALTVKADYVVSVFAPKGRYAATPGWFTQKVRTGPLRAPGRDNGVYAYGGRSTYPTSTYGSTNYWVDVVFRPGGSADPGPGPKPGWPDETNTGVPAGTALSAYNGPMTISQDNAVVDAKTVDGALGVSGKNVTISRSSITGSVYVVGDGSLTITDSFIDAGDYVNTGLGEVNFTALRVHIIGGNRSINCAENCTVRDSYVHGQFTDNEGLAHESGIRMGLGSTIVHNTIACDAPNIEEAGCSAGLTGYGDFGPVQNNLIQDNWFRETPGGACAYGGSSAGKPYSDDARDIRFIDNVFERGKTGNCGIWFAVTDFDPQAPGNVWSGNTWDTGGNVSP